jgi:hypothetical protein
MTLDEAAAELAAQLVAAGVPAVVDPRDLNLPGAWLEPGPIEYPYLDPTAYDVTWNLYLVAIDNGAGPALDALGKMLATLREAFPVPEAQPIALTLANQGAGELPGLLCTIQTKITEN